ncbi:hypothetical protein [Pseudolabrys sp.]|jgi:hypothetical protein
MTALIATLTHTPFAGAASRAVAAVKIFFEAFAEAQAQAAIARKRWPFVE